MVDSNALPADIDEPSDFMAYEDDRPLSLASVRQVRRDPHRWFDAWHARVALPNPWVRGGSHLRDELRAKVRRVFELVDQYLLQCRIDAGRHRREVLVRDILAKSRDCFFSAATLAGGASPITSDHERCIVELENFLDAMRHGCRPSSTDMLHALDGVIVHCLVLDAEHGEGASAWNRQISVRALRPPLN